MKNFLLCVMALLLIGGMPVSAQNKQLEKARKKEYKTKMKEYKNEGWKVFGTSRSLDVALLTHYEKLNHDGVYEVVGIASAFKSKNVGKQMALNSACTFYASKAGSKVQGRVASDLYGDGTTGNGEFDRFYAAYERLVEKEIKGEMQESYSIIRDNGNGSFEMQTYFVISEDAATKARLRAYENALKESEAAQKYADKVSDFIKEGFNPNEE